MKHLDEQTLALYAGGDLGVFSSLAVRWHLAGCGRCGQIVAALKEARESLAGSAGLLPADLDWEAMQAEMSANIRLGLAAGRIVETQPNPAVMAGWRTAAALASVTVLIAGGVYLHRPGPRRISRETPAALADASRGILVQASSAGIHLRENGRAMTLVGLANAPATLAVDTGGSARARYIDEETGEVTIHHVYAPSQNE